MHKVTGRRAMLRARPIALAVAAILPAGAAFAQTAPNTVPTNGVYTAGTGTIQPVTPENHLRVDQASQKGIIEWGTFSIGSAASVHFQQAFDRQGVTLNRVVTANSPSEIFGRLTSNGQLFLVNNAGVLFAPGAQVSAAAIVASTLNITDQNFLLGNYVFEKSGSAGSVVNQGSIFTSGGYTALIGPQVRNDGVIIANSGKVALGAGDRVTLDVVGDGLISISVDQAAFNAAVVNTGTIQADGGTVLLKASSANALLDTVINTSGIVRASSLAMVNGEIVLDGGGAVQVAGTVEAAGGSININAVGALNVGSTVCCFPTQVVAGSQSIEAGSITVGGGATVATTAGSQTVTTPGTLLVRGGIQSGSVGLFHGGSGEQLITAGNVEVRGGTGTNTAAFINSTAGGNQTVTVTGALTITGGAAGTGNRAGIISSGNQTINGNPDIVLTGGAGGGAGNASNNVFIQATGPDTTQQTINARTIQLRSGAGTDASATLNAARQVIATTGNVSLFGGAGLGGTNGVRIGGIGGTTLGPTNLTATFGGDLLVHGGTNNGASLGSSGASTQSNTITVTANNVTLESGGAGARIGSSSQVGATPGNISVTAAGNLQVGNGTAVRTSGPITLTANSLANDGAITNGGGANTNNIVLNANAFDLVGGNIQGGAAAVVLRPRTGTNSFGIEAAGDTTLTNADIASINTSNFIVFGSGIGTTFTGNLFIGENAAVNGGAKNLAFFRGTAPGTTTIGSQGVITSGDVIVASGLGSLVSNGGTVRGDEVQLRAAQGIGAPGARVNTAANALAINNSTAGGSFVSEQDDVTLRTISFNVGGNVNTFSNFNAGTLDLQVGGALSVDARGTLDAVVSSVGGQTISAQSVSVTARDGRTAQLLNSTFGNQQITAGTIDIETSTGGGLAEIRNNSAGSQTLTVLGDHLSIKGLGGGTAGVFGAGNQTIDMSSLGPKQITLGDHASLGRALIASNGDQTINGNADLTLIGGSGPIADGSNALFLVSNPGRLQTVNAGTVTLANSMFGGNNSVAGIQGANQVITTTGDVTMTAHASGGILPGVRIGGLGGVAGTATNLTLNVGRDLVLTGGNFAGNGVGIGATGTANTAFASNITINAPNGSVILNSGVAGSGVRIGSAATTATAPGNITINAGGDIRLNGVQETAAIRTLDTVTLNAANISEAARGTIIAGTLNTTTGGATNLSGPNQVSSYSGTSGGDLTLNNTGELTVTSLFAGNATLTNSGDVTIAGPWNSFGVTSISIASDLNVNSFVQSNGPMTLDVDGAMRVVGSGLQDASLTSFGGQTINARSVEVTSLDGRFASIGNNISGEQVITASGGGVNVDSVSGSGFAFITQSGTGGQLISASGGSGIQVRNSSGSGSGQINNFGAGSQTIQVSGGSGIEVQSLGSGFALISAGMSGQTIALNGADHLNVNGVAGNAGINTNGSQIISLTGSGANALTLGSEGAHGLSQIVGGRQTITAGDRTLGELGSIQIIGSNAPASFVGIVTNFAPGLLNTQNVSTSGALTIRGGNSPFQPLGGTPPAPAFSATGISHNASSAQTIQAGAVVLQGGGGINNNAFISSNQGSSQSVTSGSITLIGGASGQNNGAIINSSTGGNQSVTVSGGAITVIGGAGGLANRAGIVTNANQTISGNPDIVLTGGAGGGAGNNSNNVFIQATGPDTTQQTINARSIRIASGAGTDASATFNAARQVITTTGDVSIFGGAGLGSSNGARIGGIGGTTLGPTNLTLNAVGSVLVRGGSINGASFGTSGASTQANTIAVSAGGNITLESEGAGARIGSSNQAGATPGTISVTAGGSLELGDGTAVRTSGPITLTANSLTNDGAITNGGGANTNNIVLNANAFDLVGGNIQGGAAAVVLRPRTGTNSFGIEAAGQTTLTNADIASINTSNFVVLGSGIGTTFTGNMTIGENTQVDGGAKNLAFFRSTNPGPGTTTIGTHGVRTTGDVIVSAGGGAIASNGGTVAGDEVQLRAATGIGMPGARVNTAANALALNNTLGSGVFVSEVDNVTLRTVSLNVGGMVNTISNTTGGSIDFTAGGAVNVAGIVSSAGGMNVNAGSVLSLDGNTQDAVLTSAGVQSITAQSINLTAQNGFRANIENFGGSQTIAATAGDMNLLVPGAFGVAQIVNNTPGAIQRVEAAGQLTVLGGSISPTGSRNSGIFKNGGSGLQTVKAAGITLQGASSRTTAGALISSQGDQLIDVTGGSINLLGGNGGIANNASIGTSATGQQTILAHDINLANGFGGTDVVAGIFGGHQDITATGNVILTAQGSLVSPGALIPAVRIGAPGGSSTGTDLELRVGGNLVMNGGAAANNGASIGSSGGGAPQQNTIFIDAGGSVILNSDAADGFGARIGSSLQNGMAGGNITILAGDSIQLNGTATPTAIRTLGDVTLQAASISEASNGFILASTLTTRSTGGDTTLTGPNQVSSFNATSTGDVSLTNTGALTVTGLNAVSDATVNNAGNVTVSGPWTAGGTSSITVHSDILLESTLTSANVALTVDGSISGFGASAIIADSLSTVSGGSTTLVGENRVANYSAAAGADLAFFNRGALEVSSLNASSANLSNNGSVTISGPWITAAQTNITAFGLGATFSETGSGFIQATGINGFSGEGGINLNGENRIAGTLSVSSMLGDIRLTNSGDLSLGGFAPVGDVGLVNTGALSLTSLSGRNMTLTNTGPMTVSGSVVANGLMNVTVDGVLTVTATGQIPPPTPGFPPTPIFASLSASGGQNISARSLQVSAQDGAVASISNQGTGDQSITVSGGGIDVRSAGASSAHISNFGTGNQTISVSGGAGIDVISEGGSATINQHAAGLAQTIAVTNADHINLNGAGSNALISANGGAQTVSLSGTGANAIRLGSAAALGFSQIVGGSTQNVTAGLTGEQGSITIVGPAGNNAAASIVSRSGPGGTQTITTSGALSIAGGTAANGFGSGIFHNGSGLQKVTAANIALQGGSAGNGNAVQIGSFGGGVPANSGDQEINVAGGAITIVGGAAGSNNRAGISGSGNQTINGNPDIILIGGAGGGELGSNNAFVSVGLAKTQTINARNITVAAGAGGVNNSAGISAPKQVVNTTGDLTMTGGASIGQFSGTRIGGLGAGNTLSATDLTMNIGGNLLMTGGSAQFNGASIGSTLSSPALPNSITINAVGDVVLNSGTAAGARIGSSAFSDELAQGAISIAAGRSIQLNGNSAAAPTVIRTLGNVTLSAGSTISEASHGRIEAASLVTSSGSDTRLIGPNQVSSFTASSDTGNVSLRNTAPVLTLGSMELPGALSIVQAGTLSIPGTVSALSHAIDATGDVLVGSASATDAALLYALGDISIATPGSVIVRGSDVTSLGASAVLADGNLQVAAGNVSIMGGGALLAPAAMRGEAVEMSIGSELHVTGGKGHLSPAVLSSGSNIDLTVGTAVRVTEGKGLLSVARIQTEIKDGVIHISFPNLEEGGYFVNGIEGKTHHGQTGFFTLNKPAKVGKTLLLEYGD